jgi:hypothetical protein
VYEPETLETSVSVFSTDGEKQSVATPQAAREDKLRPPCSHFKIQSCYCLMPRHSNITLTDAPMT